MRNCAYQHGGAESAIMIGARTVDLIHRRGKAQYCGELLKPSFVVLAARPQRPDRNIRMEQPKNYGSRGLPIRVDEYGPDYRLETVRKDRLLVAATRLVFSLAKAQQRTETETFGDHGQSSCVDNRSPELCELTLGEVLVGGKNVIGDSQADYGITQELQALV